MREFLAAWQEPRADELRAFLSDDAVWVDGPQGVRSGADEVVDVLMQQLALGRDKKQVIDTLVADGSTVMVEWHGSFVLGGKAIFSRVMAAFEIDADGRIREMREAYDLKSVLDQMEAAGFALPK